MKPATRSRSGQPRDLDGRFIKGGSSGPVHDKQQMAAANQVAGAALGVDRGAGKSGSKVVAPVSGRQVQAVAELVSAVDSEQQDSADDNEVSSYESEENDIASSSVNSDYDNEEEEELEETGNQDSGLLTADRGQMADKVFDHMSQPGPIGPEVNLGAGNNVRDQEGDVGTTQDAPWVNLFKDNRNLGKGIMLEEWEVEGDLVMLEEEDVDVVEEAWGYCLVGLFAGRFPGMAAVRILREGWKVECTHWRHRSGWFVFKFQTEEDRLEVLNGGPYFAYGSNLILKMLPRCFRFEGEDVSSVPIWIQLPGLPLDCWNARSLGKIVSRVGKPITTDKMTLTKERLSFARVLVEVDASTDIVTEVEVRLPTGEVYHQSVVPEFIPKFCKQCMSFGHVGGHCGKGSGGTKYSAYVAKRKLQARGGSLGVKKGAKEQAVQPNVGVDNPVGSAAVSGLSDPPLMASEPEPLVGELVGGGADRPGVGVSQAVGTVLAAGLLPAQPALVTDDGGWTSVGKKGKKKKESVQSAVATVQPLPVGVTGVAVVHQGSDGDVDLAAVNQQSVGEGLKRDDPIPDWCLYPHVPRWKGKGKGRGWQSFYGRGNQMYESRR